MEEILLPIFICVILPVAIVWLVGRTKQNETNRKTEIMLKALESGNPVNLDLFKNAQKKPRTIKEDLLGKLTGACICSFMGLAFIIIAIVGHFNPGWSKDFWFEGSYPEAGGVLLAVGLGLFISYFVGRKMLAKEIEAEENVLK